MIDLTPLQTKILEIGSAAEDASWVKGRQHTGRIVAVSNKATFTEPVYNYSSVFEFIWEELTVPIAYRSDWPAAERILHQEAVGASGAEGAEEAMRAMTRRYPVPRTELEPRCSPGPPTTGWSCRPGSWSRSGPPVRSRRPDPAGLGASGRRRHRDRLRDGRGGGAAGRPSRLTPPRSGCGGSQCPAGGCCGPVTAGWRCDVEVVDGRRHADALH